jgi:hypothetical protein
MIFTRRIVVTAALALAAAAVLPAALAQRSTEGTQSAAAHEHGDEHAETKHGHTGAVSQLQLDAGQRWPTDASLREGMANIRAAFVASYPIIHRGPQTDAQYDVLADRIGKEVDGIVARCKLPPQADAQLHLVVADLLQGVSLMHEPDRRTRHDGTVLIHGALLAYGKFFDDPTWPSDPMKKP